MQRAIIFHIVQAMSTFIVGSESCLNFLIIGTSTEILIDVAVVTISFIFDAECEKCRWARRGKLVEGMLGI